MSPKEIELTEECKKWIKGLNDKFNKEMQDRMSPKEIELTEECKKWIKGLNDKFNKEMQDRMLGKFKKDEK